MTVSDDARTTHDALPEERDTASTIDYRRSLRASRARRASARLRRRRILRSRRSLLLATSGVLVVSAGAFAQQSIAPATMSTDTIAAAQKALGVGADGIIGPRTRAATKRFQRRNDLSVDGVLGPQTLAALGIEDVAVEGQRVRGQSPADPVLEQIAACESGGDLTALSADGQYRGKYQFSLQTWSELGGTGDPAQASESEQDRMAAKLLRSAGTSPWPNCA
jgi:hypothetical protein